MPDAAFAEGENTGKTESRRFSKEIKLRTLNFRNETFLAPRTVSQFTHFELLQDPSSLKHIICNRCSRDAGFPIARSILNRAAICRRCVGKVDCLTSCHCASGGGCFRGRKNQTSRPISLFTDSPATSVSSSLTKVYTLRVNAGSEWPNSLLAVVT